ncbi:response regulator transcription factor [Anoxynatronum buryatiense]|uniref:Stage 0 sporulation protein A homolog n=1 Tax=Anoxynatronum buryatiense TaxID=489973 RepID=A0AA45WXK6_9CLOT|nr:response regulator transcription factor [Anoxynatronum buryatiense]SMP62780.1 two component transcriptional regulator, LuxR family [Anoxynatronum buryatiense]
MQRRVLLVDDHTLFMEGLKYLLETYDIQVAGEARNGIEAMEKMVQLQPDLVLMDIKMPVRGGLETLREMKTLFPQVPVVMLTTSEDAPDISRAMAYGASGYLLKDTAGTDLIDFLNELEGCKGNAPGDMVVRSGDISDKMASLEMESEATGKKAALAVHRRLSRQQREILTLVAEGNTYQQTGRLLGVSGRTVKYHMERIMIKLNLKNRTQVIAYAVENQLIKKRGGITAKANERWVNQSVNRPKRTAKKIMKEW